MTITVPSSTACRIGQLVRLLGSDQGGEVVSAASHLKRTLLAAGLDLHQLAALTEGALVAPPLRHHHLAADFDLWAAVRFCARNAGRLSDREREFIGDLDRLSHRLGHRLELTPRQGAWLSAIFRKLQ